MSEHSTLLQQSFDHCKQVIQHHSKSFYQAFKLLPHSIFEGIAALYAYNRYVDDLVDDDSSTMDNETILTILNELENDILKLTNEEDNQSFYHGDQPWWPAFVYTVKHYQVDSRALINQIDGQRLDMGYFSVLTLDDLLNYSSKVAGSVGWMLLPLLIQDKKNIGNTSIINACVELGIGMQLTNILRDIGEDWRERERIYIPESLMEQFNVTRDQIKQWSSGQGKISQNFIDLWEHLNQLADDYYHTIHESLQYFHPIARLPLLSAAYIYRGIGDAVRANDYNCFTERNYTTPAERLNYIKKAKQYLRKEG